MDQKKVIMALNPVPSLLPVRVGAGLWLQLQDDRAEGAGVGGRWAKPGLAVDVGGML